MDKFILVIGILGSALLVIALVVLIYSIIRTVKRERKVTKFIYSLLTSIIILAFASAFIYLALFLQTFSRYTHEEKIGWVYAETANDSTRVTYYDKRGNRMHFFTTAGDQWVIEGYFLRWGTVLRWFGAGAYYRVTRLSGRWEKEEAKIVSIYRIHPEEQLWRFLLKHAEKIPGVDTAYGIAAFQYSSADTFYLYINDTGFILRKH
ncbi:MAG: hypothetical protein JSV53_00530 [candidate division WOR-3 bacterium]|nr:MAG: hypothetical protein JSV53_00530 [candidate division WOR-3 bacterium]